MTLMAPVANAFAHDDRSREQVRVILEQAAREPASRMGAAYRAILDEDGIERAGSALYLRPQDRVRIW